jgi:hypothetical protein
MGFGIEYSFEIEYNFKCIVIIWVVILATQNSKRLETSRFDSNFLSQTYIIPLSWIISTLVSI